MKFEDIKNITVVGAGNMGIRLPLCAPFTDTKSSARTSLMRF